MTSFLLSSKYLLLFYYYFCWSFLLPCVSSTSDDSSTNTINSDLVNKMSWKCANNATCLYAIAESVMDSYRRGDTVQFGLFDLEKLPPEHLASKNSTEDDFSDFASASRGLNMGFVEFLRGNAIRIPIGPMVFSIQRAEDDADYIEIALLKKGSIQARHQAAAEGRTSDEDGGHGHHKKNRRRKQPREKKQFQMFIPLYLAASTFGWTLVAIKAVGLLTLKALVVSKLALVAATVVIIKKLMDNASEKMMYQYPDHTPYVMPYSMDYAIHPSLGGASEMPTAHEMYPGPMQMAAGPPMHHAPTGMEDMNAESNLHHPTADLHNNTHMFAALTAAGLGGQMPQHSPFQPHQQLPLQKVKREDSWLASHAAKRPFLYNYSASRQPYNSA